MRKHTTVNLDTELLAEAQRELGTVTVTETIHQALQEVLNLRSRQRLMQLDLSSLTPEELGHMRQNREGIVTGASKTS
jgi:Arc/MetJ family transcription regulator